MDHEPVADYRQTLDALLDKAETFLKTRLGRRFGWPMRTADLLVLTKALGYVCDTKAIDRACTLKAISRPRKVGREWRWERREALDLLMNLERLRAWRPLSSLHANKMTAYEIEAGRKAVLKRLKPVAPAMKARPDFASLQPRQLIAEAVDGETVELRRWAIYCLKRRLGIVADPADVLVAEALRLISDGPDAGCRAELGAVLVRWVNSLQGEPVALRVVGIDSMFTELRSDDLATRFHAAVSLARAMGVGMKRQGFDEIEVELGAGKDVSNLLALAIGGDAGAVDQLEAVVTGEADEASDTPAELNGDEIQLAEMGALELLDELEKNDLSEDRRKTFIEALAIAAGRRSGGDERDDFCSLLDSVAAGDADAIDKARAWVVENIIAPAGC